MQRTHSVVLREDLEEEAGDDARDADEEVGDDEDNVGRARLVEHERHRVHHRRDRPTATTEQEAYQCRTPAQHRTNMGRRGP